MTEESKDISKQSRKSGVPLIGILPLIIATVIFVILVLAILLPRLNHDTLGYNRNPKNRATWAEIYQLTTALEIYYSDYKAYPEDDPETFSSRVLVEALQGGLDKKRYYPFKKERIKNGEYYSLWNEPYFYRENHSKKIKTADMHDPNTFDIWTKDNKDNEYGINNWR